MMRRSRVRRRNIVWELLHNKAFLIAVASVLGTAFLVAMFFLFNVRLLPAEKGTVSFAHSMEGMLVRSEKLYKAQNYGKTEFLAVEGQVVETGAEIANVYSWEYNDSVVNELRLVQEKIIDYLENNALKDVINKDVESLSASISDKEKEIRAVVRGEVKGDLLKLEEELQNLMGERQKYLRDAVQEDDVLRGFYQEEAALQAKIEDWKTTTFAESPGIISFYFDGAETLMTPDNMKKLSLQTLDEIYNGKTYYSADTENATRPLYRLVDRNIWYTVTVSEKEIPEFQTGSAFRVMFQGDEQLEYSGIVVDCIRDSGKFVYFFEFNANVDNLLLARQVDMQVTAEYTGIQVPLKALKTVNGVTGVYCRNEEKEKVFEPVRILIKEGEIALVEPADYASDLNVGTEIYV